MSGEPTPLVAAFLAALPEVIQPTPALGEALDDLVARARAAWPAITLAPELFVAHVAARAPADTELAGDLYLACACAHGDAAAIAAFHDTYFDEIDAAARRARAGEAIAGDARQNLARHLFTGDTPAIATYAGRGDLRGWLRIAAMREVLALVEKTKREVPIATDAFLDALTPATDPELAFLKHRYREDFVTAFHEAMAGLSDRERTLLHQQLVDGWSIDEFAAHYGAHRATAARWLKSARQTVLDLTRERLKQRWGGESGEVDSLMRLLTSRLDLSLERALGKG